MTRNAVTQETDSDLALDGQTCLFANVAAAPNLAQARGVGAPP